MTARHIFIYASIALFGSIGVLALVKKQNRQDVQAHILPIDTGPSKVVAENAPIPVDLESLQVVIVQKPLQNDESVEEEKAKEQLAEKVQKLDMLEDVDHIDLLFQKNSPIEIVQTIQYKSRAPFKRLRPAWLVDYASHYKTHLHFIARSLNGRKDYVPKMARDGDAFNILSPNVNFYFHLVVDLVRAKMWLYYVLPDKQQHTLIKTYRVGLGRVDPQRASGFLTPCGTYELGPRTAVFQPKMMGNHKGKKVELMQVFGTRWIPFEKELGPCTEPAKSYGIHGAPWYVDKETNKLVEDLSSLGRYESDGCIRLQADNMEELFSIIATHKTLIEIVPEFSQTKIAGSEKRI